MSDLTDRTLESAERERTTTPYETRLGSVDSRAWLDDNGSLPLHDAAYMGHVAMVEFLVDHDSPINEREALYQATPLSVAEYAASSDAAAFLRSRGGEV